MEEKYGEAITIANSKEEKENIFEKYIQGKPEELTSKLAVEPILRRSILGLISSEIVSNRKQLFDFFTSTFYGFQYKNTNSLNKKLENIIEILKKYKFIIEERDSFKSTLLGRRISELYLDPDSAQILIKGLKKTRKISKTFSLLNLISYTVEMEPSRVKGSDWDSCQNEIIKKEKDLLLDIPGEWDPEYDFFLASIKTALILEEWINEKSEEYILETYNIRPGELYVKLKNADWILYSCQEISRILGLKYLQYPINKTRLRVKYGIKESLLPLVKLKNVGRVRARKLFNLGINTLGDFKKINVDELSKAVGKTVAISLKEQVGIKIDPEDVKMHLKGQQDLSSF